MRAPGRCPGESFVGSIPTASIGIVPPRVPEQGSGRNFCVSERAFTFTNRAVEWRSRLIRPGAPAMLAVMI